MYLFVLVLIVLIFCRPEEKGILDTLSFNAYIDVNGTYFSNQLTFSKALTNYIGIYGLEDHVLTRTISSSCSWCFELLECHLDNVYWI